MIKKTAKPMNMEPVPTKLMNMVPDTPLHPLPTILPRITNKRQWITMQYTRHQE